MLNNWDWFVLWLVIIRKMMADEGGLGRLISSLVINLDVCKTCFNVL